MQKMKSLRQRKENVEVKVKGERGEKQYPQPHKTLDLAKEESSGGDTDILVVSDTEVHRNSDCDLPWPLKREDAIASTYFL
jgi:hypothetical protein